MHRIVRIENELKLLDKEPLPNIAIFKNDDKNPSKLRAQLIGAKDSFYENGLFNLEINLPERYPFMPPSVKFLTPIYHPNIDKAGRICLDLLTNQNEWKPSFNLGVVLQSIQFLMSNPNVDDPLEPEIAFIYRNNFQLFKNNAKEFTNKYAKQNLSKK